MQKKKSLKEIVNHPVAILFSYFISIAGLVLTITQNSTVWKIVITVFFVIYFIAVTGVLIKRFLTIKKIQTVLENDYGGRINSEIYFMSELIKTEVENVGIIKRSNKDENNLFCSVMKNNCILIKNAIWDVFSLDFDVCVKSISVDSLVNADVSSWKTRTIARAASDYTNRSSHDKELQEVSNNTSFFTIINKNSMSWAAHNIEKRKKSLEECGEEYKNPDKNYYEFYKSTIVVPIRRAVDNLTDDVKRELNIDGKKSFHYLGFLCIDSMQVFDETGDVFNTLIDFIMPIGDLMYNLYLEKLLNEIRANKLAA